MAIASFLDSPVDAYQSCLKTLRKSIRVNAPFTFIAYSSLIPHKEDDWIELASKIANFVTFNFFINVAFVCWSPYLAYLPFVPFVLDAGWLLYRMVCESKPIQDVEETVSPIARRVHALGFLIVTCLSISFLQSQH